MNARAQAKYIRQSPYKVRRVLDLVRGLPVADGERMSEVRLLTPREAEAVIEDRIERFGLDALPQKQPAAHVPA